MKFLDDIKAFVAKNDNLIGVIRYILVIALILLCIQLIRKFLRRNIATRTLRYKSQKAVEIFGYVFVLIITLFYITGNIKDLSIILGLLSAGLAFALQELILSLAGSFYILVTKVYSPGDRIEINGVKGDVIDVDSIYTTMMEIGHWVSSDNYSGRIVKMSNAFVFKVPVYNYSQDFPFIWDEIDLPIRYGSDIDLAKTIIYQVANEILSDYSNSSKKNWQSVVSKYYIEDSVVEPTIAITLTDNWLRFNLRYIVDYKERRLTKNLLYSALELEVKKTKGKVLIASTTVEIINPSESRK